MPSVIVYKTKFDYKVKRYTDGYIGTCLKIPDIDVYGKTMSEINKEMLKAVKGYFEAFPEKRSRFIKNGRLEVTV
jgi:hypothetical protein